MLSACAQHARTVGVSRFPEMPTVFTLQFVNTSNDIYIYIYMYIYVLSMCVYIYIYIYIYRTPGSGTTQTHPTPTTPCLIYLIWLY